MRIYLLESPRTYQYAGFAHVGTWTNDRLCPVCEGRLDRLAQPLLIEWEPDSEVIGDFSWCSYTMAVVTKVRDYLLKSGFECSFGRVEVVPFAKWRKTSSKPRVPYPYEGPELHWVRPRKRVRLNQEQSGVVLETYCSACKQSRYTFKREGIVIDQAAWKGCKMFRIKQFDPSDATYVTEDALELLSSKGFTNLGYLEAGMIR